MVIVNIKVYKRMYVKGGNVTCIYLYYIYIYI